MHTLVANHLIDDETLLIVSSETEKIVNDCPLTYQCDCQRDPSALMPNTLLLCNRNPCSPAGELALNYSNLADMFWTGWIKEHRGGSLQNAILAVGDLVLIVDESLL